MVLVDVLCSSQHIRPRTFFSVMLGHFFGSTSSKQRLNYLAQGHNTETPRSQAEHFTTELLRPPYDSKSSSSTKPQDFDQSMQSIIITKISISLPD